MNPETLVDIAFLMLGVGAGNVIRLLVNSCRQRPADTQSPGGSQPGSGVGGGVFQKQSRSRRGFVPEAELQPNPNPSLPGKNLGLRGTAQRAFPPASLRGLLPSGQVTGLDRPPDGPCPWQAHGGTEFMAGELGKMPCGALWARCPSPPSPPAGPPPHILHCMVSLSPISWCWCHR